MVDFVEEFTYPVAVAKETLTFCPTSRTKPPRTNKLRAVKRGSSQYIVLFHARSMRSMLSAIWHYSHSSAKVVWRIPTPCVHERDLPLLVLARWRMGSSYRVNHFVPDQRSENSKKPGSTYTCTNPLHSSAYYSHVAFFERRGHTYIP